MSFSSLFACGTVLPPWRTMRSDKIVSFTLPTSGMRPQATGAVHNAATYAILPETVGRCGWVEGKRWRVMRGESVSEGSGVCRSVGRLSWSVLIAVLDQYET